MKKKDAINIKMNKLKIKNAYKVKYKNMLITYINENINAINLLNEEINNLLKNKWIYIKNKNVYYNTKINALMPDLVLYPIGFCPIRNKFNDHSMKTSFGQYKGRIMTYKELMNVLEDDGTVQGIQYYNYTVFLNGIGYVDKDCRNIVNSFDNKENSYLSYHIPIFKLGSSKIIMDENGYDLKYADEKIKINSVSDIMNLWLQYDLVPEGLSKQSEYIYEKLMELSNKSTEKYIIEYKKLRNKDKEETIK